MPFPSNIYGMKHIRLFEEFSWDDYADKRDMLSAVAEAIAIAKSMKQDIEDSAWFVWDMTRDSWLGMNARERGFGNLHSAMNELANRLNEIESVIGPRPLGSIKFNMNKRSLLDRILGRNKAMKWESGDDSLVGRMIDAIADTDLRKELSSAQMTDLTDQIWKIHPNNPENKRRAELSQEEFEKERGEAMMDWLVSSYEADARKLKGVDLDFWKKFNGGDDPDWQYGAQQAKKKTSWLAGRLDAAKMKIEQTIKGRVSDDTYTGILKAFDEEVGPAIDAAGKISISLIP